MSLAAGQESLGQTASFHLELSGLDMLTSVRAGTALAFNRVHYSVSNRQGQI